MLASFISKADDVCIYDDAGSFWLTRKRAEIDFAKCGIAAMSLTDIKQDNTKITTDMKNIVFILLDTLVVDSVLSALLSELSNRPNTESRFVLSKSLKKFVGKTFENFGSLRFIGVGCVPLVKDVDSLLVATCSVPLCQPNDQRDALNQLGFCVSEFADANDTNLVCFAVGPTAQVAAKSCALRQKAVASRQAKSSKRKTAAALFVARELDLTQVAGRIGECLLDMAHEATECNNQYETLNFVKTMAPHNEPEDQDDQAELFCDNPLVEAPISFRQALIESPNNAKDVMQSALFECCTKLKAPLDASVLSGALNFAKCKKMRTALANDVARAGTDAFVDAELMAATLTPTLHSTFRKRYRALATASRVTLALFGADGEAGVARHLTSLATETNRDSTPAYDANELAALVVMVASAGRALVLPEAVQTRLSDSNVDVENFKTALQTVVAARDAIHKDFQSLMVESNFTEKTTCGPYLSLLRRLATAIFVKRSDNVNLVCEAISASTTVAGMDDDESEDDLSDSENEETKESPAEEQTESKGGLMSWAKSAVSAVGVVSTQTNVYDFSTVYIVLSGVVSVNELIELQEVVQSSPLAKNLRVTLIGCGLRHQSVCLY